MAQHIVIQVEGSFSLAAAAAFGFGPHPGHSDEEAVMRLAFVSDDLDAQAGAVVTQRADGDLSVELTGDAVAETAIAQIRRVLSVDADPGGWVAAGQADPVLGRLQAEHPGQRPVLFYSPYEAAAWSVLSQRRHRTQAMALRRRFSAQHGVTFELAGQSEPAFPRPEQLLAVGEFPGIEEQRLSRLHGVARAALDGQLDASALRAMDGAEAMPLLQRIKGLGPVYSMLVYLRSTGVTDGLALGEPRLAGYLRHYYGLDHVPGPAEVTQIAEPWRPFRTWASVLFRLAGERAGLPFDPPGQHLAA
jgi:DNA-3-methyladenine glycosylase II